jgi:hypothetical protein
MVSWRVSTAPESCPYALVAHRMAAETTIGRSMAG